MSREETTLWGFFLWTFLFLGFVLSAVGCASVPRAFLEGEQAAYKAISPIYAEYLLSDQRISDQQREDRLRTLRAWKFSLEKAERSAE